MFKKLFFLMVMLVAAFVLGFDSMAYAHHGRGGGVTRFSVGPRGGVHINSFGGRGFNNFGVRSFNHFGPRNFTPFFVDPRFGFSNGGVSNFSVQSFGTVAPTIIGFDVDGFAIYSY